MTSRSNLLSYVLLGALIAAATFHAWVYRDLPLVRNSVIYARIIDNMVESGPRFSPETQAYGKPLGFAVLSLPFVQTWGASLGLKMSSWFWTSLWAVSIVALFSRLRERLGLTEQHLWLVLVLALLSPLVFYQSVSAYPDTLFDVTFLWSLYFLDRTLSLTARWFDGILLTLMMVASVWVKHHGVVLIPILLAFVLIRGRQLPAIWRERKGASLVSVAAVAIMMLTLVAAFQGRVPLFNLHAVVQNYTQSWGVQPGAVSHGGFVRDTLVPNLRMLEFGFLVTLGICTPLLFWPRHVGKNLEWYVTVAIMILTLIVYRGSKLNPRYLISITPLLATFVAASLVALPHRFRVAVIGLFIGVNAYTTLYYNSIGFHDLASRIVPLAPHDNLRLTAEQRERRAEIDQINQLAAGGAKTLIVVSDYYGDARNYVLDESFNDSLRIQYQTIWDPGALARTGPEPTVVLYDQFNSRTRSITPTTRALDRVGERLTDSIWIVRTGLGTRQAGTSHRPADQD